MNKFRNRRFADMLIVVVDGLKGLPEVISAVFPNTFVQTCISHLIGPSLDFVSWKDGKPPVTTLRAIYKVKMPEPGS